jgi:1-acyl-sn-glycerol-3-phosphate acyltransferase
MPSRTEPEQHVPPRAIQTLESLLSGARAAAMGGWTLGVAQSALLHMGVTAEPARTELRQRWVQIWARGLLAVFGVEQHWTGVPPQRSRRARLVVANHRSPLDILLMLRGFGGSVLGRHDLEAWPLLGWAARHGGTIFVDRQDTRSGVKAIREIRRRLCAGQTVVVFPEGTTHRGDEVRPFQGGAFAAVRGLDAELLPVGLAYDPGAEFVDETFAAHVTRVARRPKTRVALCVGDARAAGSDRDAMASAMQREIQSLVHGARATLNAVHDARSGRDA